MSSINLETFEKGESRTSTIDVASSDEEDNLKKRFDQLLAASKVKSRSVLRDEDKVNEDDFKKLKVLGYGSFGTVYLVKKLTGNDRGKLYAMKVQEKMKFTDKMHVTNISHVVKEREVLEMVTEFPSAKFLVKLRYAFQTADTLCLVTEFYQGGDLFNRIFKGEKFSVSQTRIIVGEVIIAIEFLHDEQVIYRDLKAENILFDNLGHVVVADFGLCKTLDRGETTRSVCGTMDYMAYEILSKKPYDRRVDFYAIGILTMRLLTGLPPFNYDDDEDQDEQVRCVKSILEKGISIPDWIEADARDFIENLVKLDPDERLGSSEGISELKKHKFFDGIIWEDLKEKRYDPQISFQFENDYDLRQFPNEYLHMEIETKYKKFTMPSADQWFEGYDFTAPELCAVYQKTVDQDEPKMSLQPKVEHILELKIGEEHNETMLNKTEIALNHEDSPDGELPKPIRSNEFILTSQNTGDKTEDNQEEIVMEEIPTLESKIKNDYQMPMIVEPILKNLNEVDDPMLGIEEVQTSTPAPSSHNDVDRHQIVEECRNILKNEFQSVRAVSKQQKVVVPSEPTKATRCARASKPLDLNESKFVKKAWKQPKKRHEDKSRSVMKATQKVVKPKPDGVVKVAAKEKPAENALIVFEGFKLREQTDVGEWQQKLIEYEARFKKEQKAVVPLDAHTSTRPIRAKAPAPGNLNESKATKLTWHPKKSKQRKLQDAGETGKKD